MKKLMLRAWEIAREGVGRFGGAVKEYFAEALRIAWQEFKKAKKKLTLHEVAYRISNRYYKEADAEIDVRVWENYGKVRIYANQGFKNQIAMFEFDEGENYVGEYEEMGAIDLWGASELDLVTNAIKKELSEGVFA